MNIDDANVALPENTTPHFLWSEIFATQHALMEKYEPIEKANGIVIPVAYMLNDRHTQQRVKDFFWRATEEIGEATETSVSFRSWRDRYENDPHLRHCLEELADVVHFLVEASIIAGFSSVRVANVWLETPDRPDLSTENREAVSWLEVETSLFRVIQQLGLAANCLKNKPWKQTHVETDVMRFYRHFEQAWRSLIALFKVIPIDMSELYIIYTKKSHVNQFRQRSRY